MSNQSTETIGPRELCGTGLPPLPRTWTSLAAAFVESARRHPSRPAICDSTGADLTYGDALLRASVLGHYLRRVVGKADYVGVLLPPTSHAALANIGLALQGKIAVNLNYTASDSVVNSSIEQCGITHVLTSRKALDKFKIQPNAKLVHLEEVPKELSVLDKAAGLAATRLPKALLPLALPGLRGRRLDETATVIFTSGSTAEPKGVVLTHRNVLSNMLQIKAHVHLGDDDVVLGILPFFHSFGFTVTLWTALGLGLKAVYHFSPLDAKIIGHLCEQHRATVMAGTPTFTRSYLQRCPAEQFRTLRLLILGAEKLKPELEREITSKIGVAPLEGYGCTETGPVVSVNLPFDLTLESGQTIAGNRPGTVGRLLPGTRVRIADAETGEVLSMHDEGLIEVKGPQVMRGYLNKPEATAKVLRDGWYSTGDIGTVDPDGFLKITSRLSRFAKIGGEMVPHHAVESAICEVCGADESCLAVTSVPDQKRGERLVVVHSALALSALDIVRSLQATDMPRLWIPSPEDFAAVEALPVLGTGKLDLRAVRGVAERHVAANGRGS